MLHTLNRLLVLVFLFIGFSCAEDEGKIFRVGFSQCVSNDAWRKAMHEEMYRELSFYPEIKLEIKDANGSSALQILQIQEFMDERIDLLIVSPNESEPITPIVEEAFASGIPVIVVDRKVNTDQYSAYVGGDNYEIGYTAGQYIKALLNKKGNLLEVWGLPGSSPAKDRHQGLLDALADSDIHIIDQIYGKWERDTAVLRTAEFIRDKAEILQKTDLIFGHNDVMTIGAQLKILEAGFEKKAIGIDALTGSDAGIQAILDGVLDASFLYPTGGDKAIEIAAKILKGESFSKENNLQTVAVDSSNVKIIKQQTDRIIDQQINITRQRQMLDSQLEIYQSQRGLLFVFGITLFIAVISLAYVFKSLKDKQEINEELREKNREIFNQKEKILAFSEVAEEANRQKIDFFTNISHEFRTPLTLIQGPVEEMLQRNEARVFKSDLILIRKNTSRLLKLVNQLMDFRKLDEAKMQVRASENALIPFLEEIMSAFNKIAKDHQIRFKLICENPAIKLWFDPGMMDKVIFNLLSNSFKFTPNKGTVYLRVFEDTLKYEVVIQVEDNGEGMDAEEANHVFDRFFQGKSGIRKSGTGLGLALAKELVEIQQGTIEVSGKKGESTIFEIRMKMGKAHFKPEDLNEQYQTDQFMLHEAFLPEVDEISLPKVNLPHAKSILIVEDDPEIRNYLKDRLENQYRIFEAESPDAAFLMAVDKVPDLITCDLMLKNEDGLKLVETLKANPATAHIPIIVISAKNTQDELLKGIKKGVDDYITKPFNIAFVRERIRTILANRDQVREHYLHELPIPERIGSSDATDRKFTNAFTSLIEENISDPQFGIYEIGRKLGLSRGQLYRKVKSTLGYSVNDYIVKIRLKKAKYLLANEPMSISEIAHQTGFRTSAYFSTVFKNALNCTPSEYRESLSKPMK